MSASGAPMATVVPSLAAPCIPLFQWLATVVPSLVARCIPLFQWLAVVVRRQQLVEIVYII